MPEPEIVAGVLRIPVAQVVHGPNARGELGNVTELAHSLRELGQQQPLLVEPTPGGGWSVFDGNRRLKAAREAGLTHVLAIPRKNALTPQQRVVRQLGMHTTGRSFDPMAEARAVEWLMFADDGPHMDRGDIARALSKSQTWVKGRIDLLQLKPDEQRSVAAGTMSVAEAHAIIGGRRGNSTGQRSTKTAVYPQCDQRDRCGCRCHKREAR